MAKVQLNTSMGNITLTLNDELAPKSTENFLDYVRSGHYDGTIFHRVIANFMVQGGGMTAGMKQKPTKATIENEADNGLQNTRGSVAMARTSDPHSASSQFFINVVDNAFLNFSAPTSQGWGYAVFGKIISGIEVLDALVHIKTTTAHGLADFPVTGVIVLSASQNQ